MKRASAIFLAALCASCAPFGINVKGYEAMSEDLDTAWTKSSSFAYYPDPEGYWKSPMETERDGGGDCEDIATYLMYRLGDEASLVIVQLNGSVKQHALVSYRGFFLEASIFHHYFSRGSFELIKEISYDKAMLTSTNYGTKSVR